MRVRNALPILILLTAASLHGQENAPQAGSQAVSFGIALPKQVVNKEDPTVLQSLLNSVDYRPVPGDVYKLIMQTTNLMKTSSSTDSKSADEYNLTVAKDYSLQIPVIGSVNVRSYSYLDLKKFVLKEIKGRLPLDFMDFTLVTPGRFEVFVGGGVSEPNNIIVTSMVRLHEAILKAGGFKQNGSYRKIRFIKADGAERSVDLARFVASGLDADDPYLTPGDRILVPMAEKQVVVGSGVKFPGAYEMLPGETLDDLIRLSGSFARETDRDRIRFRRIEAGGRYTVFEISLSANPAFPLSDGDEISFQAASANPQFITVEGALYGRSNDGISPISLPTASVPVPFPVPSAPGTIASRTGTVSTPVSIKVSLPYYHGMNLYNVLLQLGGPTPFAIADRSVIYHKTPGKDTAFDAERLWKNPEEAKRIELQPDDYVFIPLQEQYVVVTGAVNLPNVLPFQPARTLEDYVALCGGIGKTGDRDSIFLLDARGEKVRRVPLSYVMQPRDIAFVEVNAGQAVFDFLSVNIPVWLNAAYLGVQAWTLGNLVWVNWITPLIALLPKVP